MKPEIKTILLIVGLTVFGHAVAGGRGNPGPVPPAVLPVIIKTLVNPKENVMVISGRNFGSTAPIVRLADYILDVRRFSEQEIVVSLPRDTQPATYTLTVTTGGRTQYTSSTFHATLFTALR